MELPIREAKARLSELIAAARNGERVNVTSHGQPAAELMRRDRRGGLDYDRLEAARRRLGIKGDGEGRPEEFNDPAFSRKLLGPDEE
ncbi:MAG: type II toxin-antitoxin system prevent-host-death family antitoxin [Alphaproteobacteria bacterium]|nr:type II toxin-antitoxin system prevent-host-death family antitoxin [Alphaproteobacteria bacterium]